MKKTVIAASVVAMFALAPGSAFAWGFAAHRLIMRQAIRMLPPELKPFFDRFQDEVVMRVVDPDLWRNVGWEEDGNHFLDFGVKEYGAYPFRALPREYSAALEKFGQTTLKRNGLLPWRTAEQFGNLRRAFEEFTRRAPYTTSNVVLFSAVTAHYVQDARQPFHATDNFDGAQTGNHGIHSRFERDLIERFESRLTIKSAALRPIGDIRDATFEALLASYLLVEKILAADKDAIAGRDTYDNQYFERFFERVQPILEQQLSDAVAATASAIVSAWDQAGRPTARLSDDRSPQRVRPGR
jgi:hypothetical protein